MKFISVLSESGGFAATHIYPYMSDAYVICKNMLTCISSTEFCQRSVQGSGVQRFPKGICSVGADLLWYLATLAARGCWVEEEEAEKLRLRVRK